MNLAQPKNSENDLLYASVGNQSARHQCQLSSAHAFLFQQVHEVSVAVSKLGYTNLISTEPGAKIKMQYYREAVLMQ